MYSNLNKRDLIRMNYAAMMSCDNWNKNQLSRRFWRRCYRDVAKKGWETEAWQKKIAEYLALHEKCVDVDEKEFVYKLVNTYPPLYAHPDFANWEENDRTGKYTLISDQSDFVIKYATSYVAWKIFEVTDVWPRRTSRKRFDAKIWQEFLDEAGYHEVVAAPYGTGFFVGINPDVGEFGTVVWYEGTVKDKDTVIYSTYRNKNYTIDSCSPDEYTWIRIK